MGKEPLREVLGVGHIVALSPHIGVKGIPVGAAERFEGLHGLRAFLVRGRQHDAPVGGGKDPRGCWRRAGAVVAGASHGERLAQARLFLHAFCGVLESVSDCPDYAAVRCSQKEPCLIDTDLPSRLTR